MTTDDRTETITDRAAIQATDEPDERTPNEVHVDESGCSCKTGPYRGFQRDPIDAACPKHGEPLRHGDGDVTVCHPDGSTTIIREPDERGDFPYYDLGPATSETVGALDLDAIRDRAKRAAWGWGAEWTAVVDDVEEWSTVHAHGKRDMVGCEDGDVVRHIAGMDPATTLAIVAEVRRLAEAENDAIRAHDDLERRLADSMADADRLLIERDEARHLLRLRSDALARVSREVEALRAKVAAVEAAARHPHKGPLDTDASMLRDAARRIGAGFPAGGSHTTAAVVRVLNAAAALATGEGK